MIRNSFFGTQRTVITALLKAETIDSFIHQAQDAEFSGADAIAAELCLLPPEQRTRDNFKAMMEVVRLPFLFCVDRNDLWFKDNDDARQTGLLAAAEAGAEVIDVMGDLYDPSPRELTRNAQAIQRQKKLIDEIHDRGAKVIISSHTPDAMTAEEVLEHVQIQADHGADMVKIVTGIHTQEQLLEAIRTTMLLNAGMPLPFVHLGTGQFSRLHRYLGMKLGVAVTFAVADYHFPLATFSQPTVNSLKNVQENLHWHINS